MVLATSLQKLVSAAESTPARSAIPAVIAATLLPVVLVYRGDQRTGTVVRSFVGLLDTPRLSCGLLRGRLGDFCFRAGSFFGTAGA